MPSIERIFYQNHWQLLKGCENPVEWNKQHRQNMVCALFSRDMDKTTPDEIVKRVLSKDHVAVESVMDVVPGGLGVLIITPHHVSRIFDDLNEKTLSFEESIYVVYKGSSRSTIFKRMIEKCGMVIDVSGGRFDILKLNWVKNNADAHQ